MFCYRYRCRFTQVAFFPQPNVIIVLNLKLFTQYEEIGNFNYCNINLSQAFPPSPISITISRNPYLWLTSMHTRKSLLLESQFQWLTQTLLLPTILIQIVDQRNLIGILLLCLFFSLYYAINIHTNQWPSLTSELIRWMILINSSTCFCCCTFIDCKRGVTTNNSNNNSNKNKLLICLESPDDK